MEGPMDGGKRLAGGSKTRDEPYLPLLRDVTLQPIFILGEHRSGTTLLYRLLVATQCFNFVSAYHITRQGEILFNYVNETEDHARAELDTLFKSLGLEDRIIDGVAVTPDLPEEYGFILRNVRLRPQLNPSNLAGFIEFCKKIQFVSNPDRPLLLKNPWDFMNFMYVESAFPTSKFIFIHRHPIHVISSLLRANRSVFAAKNAYLALIAQWYAQLMDSPVRLFGVRLLFSSHLDLGLRIVTTHAVKATSYFLKEIGSLSNTHYVSVRYEDLCEDPESNILKILSFLELNAKVDLTYDAFIQPRPLHLLPEVARRYDDIQQKLHRYFVYCGYDG